MTFTLQPDTQITSSRIYIQKPDVTFQTAIDLFNLIDANRCHILPWLTWASDTITTCAEDDMKFILDADTRWKDGTYFEYLIYLNTTHQMIGSIGVSHRDKHRAHKIEIGYWLAKEHCGYGYMQEALTCIETEFFGLGIKRIVIRNDVRNTASAHTAHKAGYQLEGVALKDRLDPLTQEYCDMNVWSKTVD